MSITIEVRESIYHSPKDPVWRAVVTNKAGHCWYLLYAGEKPSEDKIKADWKDPHCRDEWKPFVPGFTP